MKSIIFILLVVFATFNAQSHELQCFIHDLPWGENLIESQIYQTQLDKNIVINLKHDLIEANFLIEPIHAKNIINFSIKAKEVVNSEEGFYQIDISKVKPNVKFNMGAVYTELTGVGDTTASSCWIKLKQ